MYSTNIPYASQLISEIAPEIGATVWLESDYGFVGEILFANGKRHLFRNTNFNVNPLGAVEIVKDKGYCSQFLRRYGYPVAVSQTFFRDDFNTRLPVQRSFEEGWKYAASIGLPVIVKPNNLSKGVGVHRVDSKDDYFSAIKQIQDFSRVVLVEKMHFGQDYRVVVFQGEVLSAYKRIPLSIVGDGNSTILQLLHEKQLKFDVSGRDTRIRLDDPRIEIKLQKQGLNYGSIPNKGLWIQLLDNANLSSGGDSVDVTHTIHPDFANLAVRATKDMGLALCGVDIMTSDITQSIARNPDTIIIELNGAPGLDNYICTGMDQRNIVRNMYKKILLALEKME